MFRAPHSYTGEDVVEFSCHGGLYLTRRVLRAVLDGGASPAGPGEFTRRAFLNGKMGLTEAEAVMDMIGAKGRQAARTALAGRDGAIHKAIASVKDSLVLRLPIFPPGRIIRRRIFPRWRKWSLPPG